MDVLKLRTVVEDNTRWVKQAVYGVFDRDRWPELPIQTFGTVAEVQTAVSPDCSYRLVKATIEAAQATIDLYIYNVSADHLLGLLRDARGRGVRIRIMYDVMDVRGSERQKLQQLGVELKEAPSSGRRKVFTVCHQKFWVVDGSILVLGSANWAKTSIPEVTVPGRFKKGNREWLVRIDHPALAGWFADLFQADWDIPELEAPSGAVVPPVIDVEGMSTLARAVRIPDEVFDVGKPALAEPARVTPLLSPDNYFETVRALVENARTSIDLEQQYIVAGGPKTEALLHALAARKGSVEIRILVSPAFEESWDKSVETLEAAGLDDCLRAIDLESFTHLHNKGVLVDRRIAVVTSTNWSENSITLAREAGVVIESPEIGDYYGRVVDVDWHGGIDPKDVPDRLAAVADAVAAVPSEATEEIHPADLRFV